MKTGLRVPYQRRDETFMSLQVAKLAKEGGYDVEILPIGPITEVHPNWDKYVIKDSSRSVTDWFRTGLAQVIYTQVPPNNELKQAKNLHIKTILLVMWENLDEEDLGRLKEFDCIVCPAKCVTKFLAGKVKSSNLHDIPWDADIPITFDPRSVDEKRIGIIWPLDGSQAERQESDFLPMISMLLECCPNVWLTVTYSSNLPPTVVKELRKIAQFADGRCELLKNVVTDRQELLFGHHDLTVWPTLVESCGLAGLMSLSMSAPVIAFDHPVIGGFIRDGKNGVLVQCDLNYNDIQMPYVKPNYPLFGKMMVETVQDIKTITKLRESATMLLKDRRETFVSRWKKVLCLPEYANT